MKKILCLTLFACLLFPALGHAGVEGKYSLDKKAMFKQFMSMVSKRKVPPHVRKMLVVRLKKQMNSRSMWMLLLGKNKFEGWVKEKSKPKPRLGATGSWKIAKSVVTIDSVDTRRKKKSKMVCQVKKDGGLACKDARNPKLTVFFNKK